MNKTIVITGASSGIGKALALEYASRGFNLGLCARRVDKLEDLRSQILAQHADKNLQVELTALDVQETDLVGPVLDELFARFPAVDIVMVNAGINQQTKVGKGQLDIELDIIKTNVLGAVATVHAAAAFFRKQGHGHVVGISSLAGLIPVPTQAAYCATKSAFSMYLDVATLELRRANIHVTKIMPGFVKTEIVDNMEQYPFLVSAEQAAREIAQHVAKKHTEGVVPGYPWRGLKPILANLPTSVWKYIKT